MGDSYKVLERYGNSIDKVVFATHVAGSTFQDNSQEFFGVLAQNKYILKNTRIILQRDLNNEHDPNAVKVCISLPWYKSYFFAGYVPREDAELISFAIDNDEYEVITYNPRVFGGIEDKEYYGLFFNYRIITKDKLTNGKIRI